MKKALAYLFIFIGLALWVASDSPDLMKIISDKRYPLSGPMGMHHGKGGGDLVSMSYLDDEEKYYEPRAYHFSKPPETSSKNIDLYVWGDSYTLEVPDSAFAQISHYHFGRRDFSDLDYTLDPNKKNILIIEDGERFIRGYFSNLSIFDHVRENPVALGFSPGIASSHTAGASLFGIKSIDLFNPAINQNLEFNLFNYNFINPIRLLKAREVYRLFDRASGDVTVSENGKYLFLRETVAMHGPLSSYAPVGRQELLRIVDNMDTIYRHYKEKGFDGVYFSFIPNPATILQPEHYNRLLPDIREQAARKEIPMIDLYDRFSQDPDPGKLYRIGDTHWNNNGLQLWIGLVNEKLSARSH